jgi:hypothetical protein
VEKPTSSNWSTSGIRVSVPTSERRTIVDKYNAPSYQRPSNWSPGYSNSSSDFFDLYWKISLLNAMTGHDRVVYANEIRNDPNYGKWREEADRLAKENKELKGQLDKADWTPAEEVKSESSFLSKFFAFLIVLTVLGVTGLVLYHILSKRRRR